VGKRSTDAPGEPAALTERMSLSAFAPASVAPTTEFILQVWMYTEESYPDVCAKAALLHDARETGVKRGIPAPSGVWVRVSVAMPTLGVKDAEDHTYWDGKR
jgi:hypothetical protein